MTSNSAHAPETLYVAYYRVSTKKQEASGLGLEAQRVAVAGFVRGRIVAEFTETESGKRDEREKLRLAIDRAKREGAVLVIAKLDRLSRNASFIFTLRDSGVNFQCVDMPDANTLTIGIFATLAQHERELISSRTKAALSVKKVAGIKLGTPENLTDADRAKGVVAVKQKAASNENNRRASSMVAMMRQVGKNFSEIARELNESGFRTAQGKQFHAMQVRRLAQRLADLPANIISQHKTESTTQ